MKEYLKNMVNVDKKIDISGPDGNAFVLMGKCSSVLKQCGIRRAVIDELMEEAMSGDYDHLCETLQTATGIEFTMGGNSEYL